jgi:lysophospholipase L1-like esterase
MKTVKKILLTGFCCLISFFAGAGVMKYRQRDNAMPSASAQPLSDTVRQDLDSWWNFKTSFYRGISANRPIVFIGDSRVENANWSEILKRDDISERGIRGETALKMTKRLDISIPNRARAVFVQCGVNDVWQGMSDEVILNSFKTAVKDLKSKSDHVVISSIIQMGRNYEDWHNRVAKLNPRIKDIALAGGAEWMDLNPILCPDGYLSKDQSEDGIHFGFSTYRAWSRQINKKLSELKL